MAFYLFPLLLLLAPQLNAQTCDCVACLDEAAVFTEATLYYGSCASPSQIAVITELEVNSPDGDAFQVFTRDTPTSDLYYTAATTSSKVTCYNKGSGNVGGSNSIAVVLDCDNYVTTCNVEYRIRASCLDVGDGAEDGYDGTGDGNDGGEVPTCYELGITSQGTCDAFCGGTYMWGFYNGLISCDCLTGLACADVPGTGDGYDGTADGYDGTGDGNDGTGDGKDGTGDGNDGNEDGDGGDPKGDGANANHITPFAFNNLF